MPTVMLGVLALFAVVGSIGTSIAVRRQIGHTRERIRVRRALRAAPELSSKPPEGTVVAVTGVVRPLEPELIAPLSGAPCVLYRSRAIGSFWTTRLSGAPYESFEMRSFLVDGGSAGIVVVTGKHAVLDIPMRRLPVDQGRRLGFLAIHGLTGTGRDAKGRPMSRGHYRFHELLVSAGDRISVTGVLMRDVAEGPGAGEVGYREDRLETRVVGNWSHPLQIRVHAD